MLGEHCYACGQPTKGLVRHFSSIVGDFVDSVLGFDSRTVRTVGPLLFQPGRLTQEYFHGHRVRYTSPVRLFFFLCIAAIFAVKLSVGGLSIDPDRARTGISSAETAAEVEAARKEIIGQLEQARLEIPAVPGARAGVDAGIRAVEDEATRRLAWIKARDAAISRGESAPEFQPGGAASSSDAPPEPDTRRRGSIRFGNEVWHPETNPVTISWLPDSANARLNELLRRAELNSERVVANPKLLVDAFMEALPPTLFLLLPLFALMLKLFYLFKRRLYMEHLIVALHSHAFLCAAVLALTGLDALQGLASAGGWMHSMFGWGELAVVVWIPIYLLLMQKHVYHQGWMMTVIKYFLLGNLYLMLLSVGATLNLAFSVVVL